VSAAGTLEALVGAVADALAPVGLWLSPPQVDDFFAQLGMQFSPSVTTKPSVLAALQAASAEADAVSASAAALKAAISSGSATDMLSSGLATIGKIGDFIHLLDQIGQQLNAQSNAFPGIASGDVVAFSGALSGNILDAALIAAVQLAVPDVVNALAMVGIIDRHLEPGTSGDPAKPPYETRRLRLDRIAPFLQSPPTYLQSIYNWGSSSFDGKLLFDQLVELAGYIGLPAVLVPAQGGQPASLNLFAVSLQVDPATAPPSLKADLLLAPTQNYKYVATLAPTNWTMTAQVSGTFAAGMSARLSPVANISLVPPSGTLSGEVNTQFSLAAADANQPIVLIGQTGGSVLQTNSVTFGAGLVVTWNPAAGSASAEPSIQGAVTGGKLVIDMSEADGFLSDVTSGTPIEAGFDLAFTWQPDSGLHITGGAQLEIDLPLHLSLGPVTLPTVYIVGGFANGDITLELSAALGVTLGPIAASVDRVGMLGTLSFPSSGGNLGFANLALGFKPPNGLGLSIDAGVISGGGYISFDPSQGQYAGVIQLTLLDIIGITVITVLDTKMPDGSSGFSLLFVITFTLPPIQLGFGFTLIGVGGIGGVNRTMDTNALQAGFMAHTLDSIMFPPNPIANAPQIISDMRSFFPPADGRYLFGPLLEFGWGTPTLISMSVGAILSVPDPIVLALIGLIDAGLPTEDVALVELHIEVLGIIDFGAKYLSIEGTLYDSRVLIFSMGGSLALEVAWGDDPNFVFSLGGFNPNFNTAGLNIGPMARCSVSIGDGDNPRISANNYYAITSNSFQFGANVQAYASAAGFTIQGYLGFDVLIIISPFSFEFDFQAGFSVSFEGISLIGLNVDGLFSGPTPWHFHGDASISILFFSVSASLDLTWGDSTQATIPAKPVLPDLFAALKDPRNWNTTLPAGASVGVSLVTLKPTDTTLRVHPMGTLTVREKVVPLDLPITKYGNATPSDGDEFSIQSVQINAQAETIQSVQDYFAIGQFETLSDSDKLSKPSFEDYDSGVTIGSATVVSGEDRARTVTYQEYYIDTPLGFSRFTGHYMMPAAIHAALSAQGAGFTSPLKNSGMAKYTAGPQPAAVTVEDPPYVVANITDLSIRSDISSSDGTTYFQAQAAMQSHLAANPNDVGSLQIVPIYELAA
jgi:hypothetical protein